MIHDKVLWFDTETTGLDPKTAAILSIGYVVELNGESKEEGELRMAPWAGATIEAEALQVNGFTLDQVNQFPPPGTIFQTLKNILTRYVDPFNPADKFVMAGYRVDFDAEFLRSFWKKFDLKGDKYFGSWFWKSSIDVATYVAEMHRQGFYLKNVKLQTLCQHFGIPLDAHNALSDVRATKRLYTILKEALKEGVSNGKT